MIFAPDGSVNAVVDWELTAIGRYSPTSLLHRHAHGAGPLHSIWVPRPDDGFPTTDELIDRYQDATGHEVDVGYYSAFAMEARLHPRRRVRDWRQEDGRPRLDPEAGAGVEDLVDSTQPVGES